uniref:Uncharacterized protein n=1 Tax=Oryza meridionalis TaxID=40149 RepID=A0A0E0EVF9_9ORYZ
MAVTWEAGRGTTREEAVVTLTDRSLARSWEEARRGGDTHHHPDQKRGARKKKLEKKKYQTHRIAPHHTRRRRRSARWETLVKAAAAGGGGGGGGGDEAQGRIWPRRRRSPGYFFGKCRTYNHNTVTYSVNIGKPDIAAAHEVDNKRTEWAGSQHKRNPAKNDFQIFSTKGQL